MLKSNIAPYDARNTQHGEPIVAHNSESGSAPCLGAFPVGPVPLSNPEFNLLYLFNFKVRIKLLSLTPLERFPTRPRNANRADRSFRDLSPSV